MTRLVGLALLATACATPPDPDERVAHHLADIAAELRDAPASPARARTLDHLDDYRARARFPRSPGGPEHPIFIDEDGTECAVGYLMIASGRGDLAERLARRHNTAWLLDMDEPAIRAWAATTGLTVEELARIQPGYSGMEPPTPTPHYPPPQRRPIERQILAQLDDLDPAVARCGTLVDAPQTVRLAWTVQLTGEITDVSAPEGPVGACVADAVAGMTLARSQEHEPVRVTVPFVVRPTVPGDPTSADPYGTPPTDAGCDCAPGPAVCGNNGLTYVSACRATCQGVPVRHTGACES